MDFPFETIHLGVPPFLETSRLYLDSTRIPRVLKSRLRACGLACPALAFCRPAFWHRTPGGDRRSRHASDRMTSTEVPVSPRSNVLVIYSQSSFICLPVSRSKYINSINLRFHQISDPLIPRRSRRPAPRSGSALPFPLLQSFSDDLKQLPAIASREILVPPRISIFGVSLSMGI